MAARKSPTVRFAICVRNAGYPASLELHKVYRLKRDAAAERDGELRIIDESGEDYLYPAEYFVVTDVSEAAARSLRKSFAAGA